LPDRVARQPLSFFRVHALIVTAGLAAFFASPLDGDTIGPIVALLLVLVADVYVLVAARNFPQGKRRRTDRASR
jgi:hypothetical protein